MVKNGNGHVANGNHATNGNGVAHTNGKTNGHANGHAVNGNDHHDGVQNGHTNGHKAGKLKAIFDAYFVVGFLNFDDICSLVISGLSKQTKQNNKLLEIN